MFRNQACLYTCVLFGIFIDSAKTYKKDNHNDQYMLGKQFLPLISYCSKIGRRKWPHLPSWCDGKGLGTRQTRCLYHYHSLGIAILAKASQRVGAAVEAEDALKNAHSQRPNLGWRDTLQMEYLKSQSQADQLVQ